MRSAAQLRQTTGSTGAAAAAPAPAEYDRQKHRQTAGQARAGIRGASLGGNAAAAAPGGNDRQDPAQAAGLARSEIRGAGLGGNAPAPAAGRAAAPGFAAAHPGPMAGGYADIRAAVKTPRGAEYQAFARVTGRLSAAQEAGGPGGFAELAAALHDNQRLWAALAQDVAGEANGLPEALRARLFYLAAFTRAHSARVLSGAAGAGALIEVNTAVMRGLRAAAPAGAPAQDAAAAPAAPSPVLAAGARP